MSRVNRYGTPSTVKAFKRIVGEMFFFSVKKRLSFDWTGMFLFQKTRSTAISYFWVNVWVTQFESSRVSTATKQTSFSKLSTDCTENCAAKQWSKRNTSKLNSQEVQVDETLPIGSGESCACTFQVKHQQTCIYCYRHGLPCCKQEVRSTEQLLQREKTRKHTIWSNYHIYSWNPNYPCFEWKGPCFGGFDLQK